MCFPCCIIHEIYNDGDRVPFQEINEPGNFLNSLEFTRAQPDLRYASAKSVLDALMSLDQEFTDKPEGKLSKVISVFSGNAALYSTFWNDVDELITTIQSPDEKTQFLNQISIDHIRSICEADGSLANHLGCEMALAYQDARLDFDFCDVIANRLEVFVENGETNTAISCLFSMLIMGNRHNRFFVQRKFSKLCDVTMPINLAEAACAETFRMGRRFCDEINILNNAINKKVLDLHPRLQDAYRKLCN